MTHDAVHAVLMEWSLPPWLTAGVVVLAFIYCRGWFAIRRTRPKQFTSVRLASFLSGLAVLWVAVGSPMDGFADALLSAHMVEHLLLMSVVPPLLLCGLPAVPLLRGLPAIAVRIFLAPVIRNAPIRRFAHWLVRPLVAWLLMNLCFLGWHIPSAYDFALEHENWHIVEHVCFLVSSIAFWWVILAPWPSEKSVRNWGVLIFLVAADIVNTMLSAFLAFCGRPVYRFYADHPGPFHVSLLDDQVLGAVIMWVFGSLAFLVPAAMMSFKLLQTRRPEAFTG